MEIEFSPGFTIFGSRKNPVWVAPHSGPAFNFFEFRDENTDIISGFCFSRRGGTMIVSNTSRSRMFGIDFNRIPPPIGKALEMYKVLLGGKINQDEWYEYRKKYAWVACDRKDHEKRLGIYDSFWGEVNKSDTVVFIHRMFTSPGTAESLMDIFFRGYEKNTARSAVKEINENYEDFFRSVKRDFLDFMVLEEKRKISYIMRTPREKIEREFLDIMENHKRILKAEKMSEIIPKMEMLLGKEAPNITMEKVFKGMLSHGLYNLEEEKKIMQLEVSTFLGSWYPEKAGEMICGILEILEGGKK